MGGSGVNPCSFIPQFLVKWRDMGIDGDNHSSGVTTHRGYHSLHRGLTLTGVNNSPGLPLTGVNQSVSESKRQQMYDIVLEGRHVYII